MRISKKIVKLAKMRGLYILLTFAIGLIGISGYMANLRSRFSSDRVLSVISEPEQPRPQVKNEKPFVPPLPVVQQDLQAAPVPVVASAQEKWEADVQLILPLQGELGMGYFADELVYNKTMQDWRTHPGVDIRADVGTPIKSAERGIVSEIFNDPLMGFTVKVLHPDGFETIYSNLQTGQLVEENEQVKKGDIIGGVGTTAICEIGEPPHLHFEVKKDGEHVNPFDYIA